MGGFASNAVSPHLFKADFDPIKDFAPIGLFGTAPTVLVTHMKSPYKTIKDMVDAAKKKRMNCCTVPLAMVHCFIWLAKPLPCKQV